jgi:hypothetical protein
MSDFKFCSKWNENNFSEPVKNLYQTYKNPKKDQNSSAPGAACFQNGTIRRDSLEAGAAGRNRLAFARKNSIYYGISPRYFTVFCPVKRRSFLRSLYVNL